jgi:SAM-dependent methyltransferase
MSDKFAYDAVRYESRAMTQAHPDRLYTLGTLYGLAPKPAADCRYLEVGCGIGKHLIAAALTLPRARFVGIDLARTAVERGRQVAADLGLTNVRLEHADLTAWDPGPEPFDYVVAHGVYSWVPAAVRDRLLDLCRRALGPDGLAFVSYNALPGALHRRILWDGLKFHTRGVDDPAAKVARAREYLQLLQAAYAETKDITEAAAGAEATDCLEGTGHLLYHDDLSPTNDPVYLTDFARHAGEHGLRFVGDAKWTSRNMARYPPEVSRLLDEAGRADPLVREQYRDFVTLCRFHNTVLCLGDRSPAPDLQPAAVGRLYVSTLATRGSAAVDLAPGARMTFRTSGKVELTVDVPAIKAVFTALEDATPQRLSVPDLEAAVGRLLGGLVPAGELAGLLLNGTAMGFLDLHGGLAVVATAAGDRPVASPLARLEAATGNLLTTLLHTIIQVEDEPVRALVRLMDGTRDRAALRAGLASLVPADQLAAGLDGALRFAAAAGLLMPEPAAHHGPG